MWVASFNPGGVQLATVRDVLGGARATAQRPITALSPKGYNATPFHVDLPTVSRSPTSSSAVAHVWHAKNTHLLLPSPPCTRASHNLRPSTPTRTRVQALRRPSSAWCASRATRTRRTRCTAASRPSARRTSRTTCCTHAHGGGRGWWWGGSGWVREVVQMCTCGVRLHQDGTGQVAMSCWVAGGYGVSRSPEAYVLACGWCMMCACTGRCHGGRPGLFVRVWLAWGFAETGGGTVGGPAFPASSAAAELAGHGACCRQAVAPVCAVRCQHGVLTALRLQGYVRPHFYTCHSWYSSGLQRARVRSVAVSHEHSTGHVLAQHRRAVGKSTDRRLETCRCPTAA